AVRSQRLFYQHSVFFFSGGDSATFASSSPPRCGRARGLNGGSGVKDYFGGGAVFFPGGLYYSMRTGSSIWLSRLRKTRREPLRSLYSLRVKVKTPRSPGSSRMAGNCLRFA